MTIVLNYGVTFGKCDGSDILEWDVELTDEQEKAYKKAWMTGADPDDVPELQKICDAARPEIEEVEIQNGIDYDDDYTRECQGEIEVDADDINELVHAKDKHALDFFDLNGLSDAELEEWDANDLDELPLVKDFDENFEPESPFDGGYCLSVWIPEFECPDEEDTEQYLREAFKNGDLELVDKVVRGQDYSYFTDLSEIAREIAKEMGCQEYLDKHST